MESINFLGDLILGDQPVLFGCGFDSTWGEIQYRGIFDGVKKTLLEAEWNVANFEAVMKERPPQSNVNNWAMCCDSSICDELIKNNIKIVSIANNHTLDYGEEAFEDMIRIFEKAGISVVGKAGKPWKIIEIAGKKVAIIAASYLPVYRTKNIPYFFKPTKSDWERVLSEIGTVDKTIAYIHWGSEFVTIPTKKQIAIRDELLTVGIDDIIGHHSHILQEKQHVGNHYVFYSLGNFLSDYWQRRLRKTEILKLDFKLMEYKSIPCEIQKKGTPLQKQGEQKIVYSEETAWKQKSLFFSRLRMRLEYLFRVMYCFPRIKSKKVFLKWFWERVVYVLGNMFKETKDPEIIYKKYRR